MLLHLFKDEFKTHQCAQKPNGIFEYSELQAWLHPLELYGNDEKRQAMQEIICSSAGEGYLRGHKLLLSKEAWNS
jgi:hypothetical protein